MQGQMVRVDMKAISMGRIWSTGPHGKRFLTKEGKAFKSLIGMICRKNFPGLLRYDEKKKFTARFYGKWRRKDGKISKTAGDLDNFNKLILDGISEEMGFNDAEFYKSETEKIDSDNYYFEFMIEAL